MNCMNSRAATEKEMKERNMGIIKRFTNSRSSCFFHLMFLLLILQTRSSGSSSGFSGTSEKRCRGTEREALLAFKKLLIDPSGRLSSWSGNRCCEWTGVGCDGRTGHIVKLDLRNPYQLADGQVTDSEAYRRSCLRGKLSPSLLSLRFLSYLDLSLNDFEGVEIPEFLGGFPNLKYLNLSYASFSGAVPSQLGNLSILDSLDLYGESFSDTGEFKLHTNSLNWISGLSSLKYMDLGYVDLSSVGESWLQAVNRLPSLVELHLFRSELQSLPSSMQLIKLTSLSVLDLSENSFNSPIPKWLFDLTSLRKLYLRWDFLNGPIPNQIMHLKHLEVLDLSNNLGLEGRITPALGYLSELTHLDLSANNFGGGIHEFLDSFARSRASNLVFLDLSSNSLEGTLPESLGSLKKLQILDISSNSLSGSIPRSISNLLPLKRIDLSYNKMNGTIPESFGQLSELGDVNFVANSWQGTLNEAHFEKLKRLESFRVTTVAGHLVFDLPYKWVPPFRVKLIQIENCRVGPFFPIWLQVQTSLTFVILRNVGISDRIPKQWFSKISSGISYLILSNNEIKGELPRELESPNLSTLDLSFNRLEGPLPLWSTNATDVFLHDNLFQGSLPPNIGKLLPRLQKLYVSGNNLNGVIPSSLCEIEGLQVLSLRDNRFAGGLPNCWHHSLMLWGIDAANNSLTGQIPSSLGRLPSLSVLLLSDNNLNGLIPSSLQSCTGLTSIDLRRNKIAGTLPVWIEKFSSLFMLRLGLNSIRGEIPKNLCSLQNLHILDFSGNRFSGSIPRCVSNLTALAHGTSSEAFENLLNVVTRRREPEFSKIRACLNSIDLSRNNITGEIPEEILSLSAMRIFNLSTNLLTESIPEKIGELRSLEVLDLSRNHLSGMIPQSLASLASLTLLNLSYNNLSGQIPPLLKFNDTSIFRGNPSLCGNPLPKKCTEQSRVL